MSGIAAALGARDLAWALEEGMEGAPIPLVETERRQMDQYDFETDEKGAVRVTPIPSLFGGAPEHDLPPLPHLCALALHAQDAEGLLLNHLLTVGADRDL